MMLNVKKKKKKVFSKKKLLGNCPNFVQLSPSTQNQKVPQHRSRKTITPCSWNPPQTTEHKI